MEKISRYLKIAWLPVVLTALLVIETYFFNRWLNIIPNLYFFRRAAATIGLGVLAFWPALFIKKRNWRHVYLLAISILVSLIFISEFLYYEYSRGFLEFSSIFFAGESSELGGTIKLLLTWKLLLFVLPIAVIIFSWTTKFWGEILPAKTVPNFVSKKEKLVAIAVLVVMFVGGYGVLLGQEKREWGDTTRLYQKIYDLGTLVGKMGIVNFYIEDAVRYAVVNHGVTAAQTAFVQNWVDIDKPAPEPAPANFGIAKGRNLIVIQVESLENWPINATVNGQEITPNLNQLAKDGMYFTDYYSQIGEGNTADAEFSTMNSLYPLPDSVVFINHPKNTMDALPGELKDNGYETAVMHGDVATFWNRSNVYPGMGYEKIFSRDDYNVTRQVAFDGLGDADFFQQNIPKLESLKQPFMSTMITLSSHTPFDIPEDLRTLDFPDNSIAKTDPATSDDGDINLYTTRAQYVRSVGYADKAIGDLIAGLKKDGLYDNSVIVIYGDHNAFIDTSDSSVNRVPMILLAPGLPITGINSNPASHLDLYPTLVNLLGLPAPKAALGQDVLNTPTPAATQRNTITGTIKFIDSKDKKYTASTDGNFQNGSCIEKSDGKQLQVDSCLDLYNQENNKAKVSDIVVRYNKLNLLTGNN